MLGLSLGLFVVAVSLWLLWRKQKLSYFKHLNIPGPEPSLFFGNLKEILEKTPVVCHREWAKKYGKIFGYYYGLRPVLMVGDVDVLRNIEQKDFHKFANRPETFDIGSSNDDKLGHALVSLKDKKWKDTRSILTPTFTSSKLKQMNSIVSHSCEEMTDALESEADTGKTFNIYEYFQRLTMDVIGRTAFGIQTNVQRDARDPILLTAKAFLSVRLGWWMVFAYSFIEFSYVFAKIKKLFLIWQNEGKHPASDLAEKSYNILKARRQDSTKKRVADLLQLMMEAQMSLTAMNKVSEKDLTAGDDSEIQTDDKKSSESSTTSTKQDNRKMTDTEIIENSVLFFIAGYETTSTALSFVTHFLVHYPDVQEKVRNEINDLLEEQQCDLDYTSVQQLRYLDQVINESLRMYAPVYLFVNRKAAEDVQYGSIRIKKGMAIQVPINNLHHDPSLWEKPEVFDPERFSAENKRNLHPLAWQPFGAGPRNCIGMRFAQMEAKMALAKLLKKYRLVSGKETEQHPLDLSFSNAIMRPAKGMWVKLEKVE